MRTRCLAFGLLTLICHVAALAQSPAPAISPRLRPGDFPAAQAYFAGLASCATPAAELVIDGDNLVDFSGLEPRFSGDADLAPYFSYERQGSDPSKWKALFDCGDRPLRLAPGALLTVATITQGRGAASPGLELRSTCAINLEGTLRLLANNEPSGDLTVLAGGDLTVAGHVQNAIEGTWATTGSLTLATKAGHLRVTATGFVEQLGTQQGARQVNLLAFDPGANLEVRGRVESSYSSAPAPLINLAAFAGSLLVDGTQLIDVDAQGNRLTSGVHLFSRFTARPDRINLVADGDLTVLGYGNQPWSGAASASFTLNRRLRSDSPLLPVSVTLANAAPDQVSVHLAIPPGSGFLRAFYANLVDESLVGRLSASGAQLGPKQQFAVNATQGLPNYWMAPPGNWDFALSLGQTGQNLTSIDFTLSAPGLVWQQLLAGQSDGYALGVILSDLAGDGKSGDSLGRVGMLTPLQTDKQVGAVAAKAKRGLNPGGSIYAQSLHGRILASDQAFDVAGAGGNANAVISLEAQSTIDLRASASPLAGTRRLLDSSGAGQGAAGSNKLRSYADAVQIGPNAALLALGDPVGANLLTACTGVFNDGLVSPTDTDPSDDSGVCPLELALSVAAPAEGAYLAHLPVTVSGQLLPAEAQLTVDGVAPNRSGTNWQLDLNLPEGPHTIEVRANLLDQSAAVDRHIVVDTLPPVIQLAAPDQATQGQALDFSWAVTDASPLTAEVSLAGTVIAIVPVGSHSLTVPVDPQLTQLTIRINAVDAAGNLAVPVEKQVLIHPPSGITVAITSPAAGTLTNAASLAVSGTVSAGASVVVNGVAATVTDTSWLVDLPLAGEGNLLLTAVANLAGQSAQAEVAIERDTTPPVVTLDAPERLVRGQRYTLNVAATDAHPVTQVALRSELGAFDPVAAASASFELVVPSDEARAAYQLVAEADDAAGNRGQTSRSVLIVDPDNLPGVVVTIRTPEHRALFADPAQELVGDVVPASASLTLVGQALTVAPDGSFRLPVTLATGLNTYLLRGEAPGYGPGTAKVDLYLDDLDPVVTLLSPQADLRTNQATVEIVGTAQDQYDDAPSLTRDGQSIDLAGGRFRETVQLQQGPNTFVYTATDRLGHTGSASLTVTYETQVVSVRLEHPDYIQPGQHYSVAAIFAPEAEVARTEVYVDQALVHHAAGGARYQGGFDQAGLAREIPLLAVATDHYGNRVEARGTITVGWPHFVHGQVLADATSYPLAGVPVTVTTPLGQTALVTDAAGGYQAYVYGFPVDVATGGAYVAIQRHMPDARDSWRVPDLRLTPVADPRPAGALTAGNNQLDLSGFGGDVQVTALSAQGIAELLPLGYAPLAAFNLAGASGQGTIDWRLAEPPLFDTAAPVAVLERQGRAWRVRAVGPAAASTRLSNAGNGDYLLAVLDRWQAQAPAVGSLVQRESDPVVPPNTLALSLTQPARVSVFDDPQTRFSCTVHTAGELVSGTRARLSADEVHERFSETVRVPTYDLDFFVYSVGFAASATPSELGGSLDIRAREQVLPERTERAEITFASRAGEVEQAGFLENPLWDLGDLTLDFSGSATSPRAIFAQRETATLDGAPQTQVLAAFSLEIGGSLERAPQLRLAAPASAAVLLLRGRDRASGWDYVATLGRESEFWQNDPQAPGLRESGRYLLLALDYQVCEVSGQVSYQSQAVAGADLYLPQLAWRALSAADGSYRIALPQDPQSRALSAHHDGLRREGQVLLAPTAGSASRSGQDIELGNRDFRLIHHDPLADQQHVDYLPSLTLEFNRPVSDDAGLLAAHLRLSGPDGEIPLEIVAQPGRYVLSALPLRALSPQTQYHFRADSGLLSLDGDPLSQAVDFAFTTRVPAVTRQLDLSAFTLSFENGRMFLLAPAEAYVAGTVLRVFNPDNGAGFGATLATGDYRAEVNAQPGDTIELRATDPAGNSFQRTIDLTQIAPDTYRLGTRPFVLRINEDVVLRVDEILEGAGTELIIRQVANAAIAATAADVAALENAPQLTPIQGIEFKVMSGPMPNFKARLQLERDLAEYNDRALVTASFQPDIMAPANPERPSELTPHTLMRIHEAFNVADGAPAPAPGTTKQASADKFSLIGTMISISISTTHGLAPGDLVATSIFLAIMVTGAPLNPLNHPVSDYVECSRRQVDLQPPIIAQPYQSRPWHANLDAGYYPVPGVPVYEAFVPNGGSSPSYRLLGISDAGGRADCHHFFSGLGLRGVDPVTGQIAWASYRSFDNVTQFVGYSLLTYANRPVKFDPEQYRIELGDPPPPQLKTRWEVGTLVDGEFVVDAARTQRLRDDRKVVAHSALQLRLTVQSSQPLATTPEPQLSLVGLTAPGNPEIDGNNVTWGFAPGVLAQGGLVEATVTLSSTIGTQNSVTDRFVVIGEGPATEIPGAAPFVLYTNPADEATKVLVADAVTVAFSEPVHRIDSSHVRLLDEGGSQIALTFWDERGEKITDAASEAAVLHIVPAQGLRFDRTYRLRVEGVVDRENLSLEEPFEIHFKTAPFDEVDNLAVTYRTQVAGMRNLTLVLTEDFAQTYARLDRYDARDPYKPMKLIGTSRLKKGYDDAFLRMELFTPQDLRETSTGISAPSDGSAAYDDLPSGTLLVLTRQRFPNDVAHVELYRFSGGNWDRLFGYDSLERGLIYDTAKMGRYLILAHKILGYWSYEPFVPAKVVVLDVQKMLDEYERVLAEGSREGRLRFEAEVQNFAAVAKYPLPGDVSSVTSFARKEYDGDFTAQKPAFLASGYYHPAVYDFDLSRQPPFPGMAMPSSDPNFDGRLVVRMPYLHGPTALRLDNGAISGFAYRDPVRGLREIDLAIFMERHSDGQIHFFEVPRTGGTSEQSIVPLKTLEFPAGIFAFAVDPGTGLLAVQGLDRKFSVLDIKAFLETASAADRPGFEHPAFMFPAIAQNNQLLTFIEGNLYGQDSQTRRLVRTPVSPRAYRTVGFEYYDLNTWANPPSDPNATHPNLVDKVLYAKNMVYYATDLAINNRAQFVMEQGSFAIELPDGGDIHLELLDDEGNVIAKRDRNDLVGRSTQTFALKDVRDYYKDLNHQRELRTQGFKYFKLKYRVSKNGTPEAEDDLELLVAYRTPDTRYFDPTRKVEHFDLLAQSPYLTATDFEQKSLNPAISLTPSRAYHIDYGFQSSIYGPGMLSSQLLHLAMPTWWRIGALDNSVHNGDELYPRLLLEQPGLFGTTFEVAADGLTAKSLDALDDRLFTDMFARDWIHFGHNATWRFNTKDPLPRFKQTFELLNHGIDEVDELHFPVFRFAFAQTEIPPSLTGAVPSKYHSDLAWHNQTTAVDEKGQPSGSPTLIREMANDQGGAREANLQYESGPLGRRVVVNRLPGGVVLNYHYDSSGYLDKVTTNGQRPLSYTWEDLGIKVGALPLKRLRKVTWGEGAATSAIGFDYQAANYKVTGLSDDFGPQTIQVLPETTGLPKAVVIGGAEHELNRGAGFSDAQGLILATTEHCGLLDFRINWEKKVTEASTGWLLTGHEHLQQAFTYDDKGRLLRFSRSGYDESYTYGNSDPGFEHVPTSYTDAEHRTYTLITNRAGASISQDGISKSWMFSGSGAVIGFTDPLGLQMQASSSSFYVAVGQGFQAQGGRPTRIPFAPGSAASASRISYTPLGDMAEQVDMGERIVFSNYDALGRPGLISRKGGGVLLNLSYGIEDGLYVNRAVDTGSGTVVERAFNRAGLVMRYSETHGSERIVFEYTYDSLGRLTLIVDGQGNPIYQPTFDDLSSQPASIVLGQDRIVFNKADGYQPRVLGVTRERDGLSRTETFAVNQLGQLVASEERGEGSVTTTYDGFSRVSKRVLNGGPAVQYTYSNGTIHIDDQIRGLDSTYQLSDSRGLQFSLTQRGQGMAPIQRTITTSIEGDAGGKGYILRRTASGGELERSTLTGPEKRDFGSRVGDQVQETNTATLDRHGNGRQQVGDCSSDVLLDDLGRPISLNNQLTQPFTIHYDKQGRPVSGTEFRGKDYGLDYHGSNQEVAGVRLSGENRAGLPELVVREKSAPNLFTDRHWLGAQSSTLTLDLDSRYRIDRNGQSVMFEYDPASSQIKRAILPDGRQRQWEWQSPLRVLRLIDERGVSERRYDSVGRFIGQTKPGAPELKLERDGDGRLRLIQLDNRQFRLEYDGTRLTSASGDGMTFSYSNYGPEGEPRHIALDDFMSLDFTYHPNGQAAQTILRSAGEVPTVLEQNIFGDLIDIRRGLDEPLHFTYNLWGAPETLSVGNKTALKLMPRFGELQLPGGIAATIDESGRLASLETPGLAPRLFGYDSDGNVIEERDDQQTTLQRTFDQGTLTATAWAPRDQLQGLTERYGYDARGRSATIDSSLDGVQRYAYFGDEDHPETLPPQADQVESFTDVNGVVQTYRYDSRGNISEIAIADGPTFRYSYNDAQLLTEAAVDGLSAKFDAYRQGRPSRMTWHQRGELVQAFDIALDHEGKLQHIAGGPYQLDLIWTQPPEGQVAQIQSMRRQGPGFAEIWSPRLSDQNLLEGVSITRIDGSDPSSPDCGDCQTHVINEDYAVGDAQLPMGLRRRLDGLTLLDLTMQTDPSAADRRVLSQSVSGQGTVSLSYDRVGDLTGIAYPWGVTELLSYDASRQLRGVEHSAAGTTQEERYRYDHLRRRVGNTGSGTYGELVYIYRDSRVIAIGQRRPDGSVQWTHAVGHGPMGPVFLSDLTGAGNDYFIFTDHLGTPFAYRNAHTGQTYYTPYNPWGELLAPQPAKAPAYAAVGSLETAPFQLPPDAVFPYPPLGLSGHVYDHRTGLVYMHHRYYHPRLGQFVTPDFRQPNLYDLSTFKEPYAYAAGNPVYYWDPDGLSRRNIHGYFTYFAAYAAGLPERRARTIAFFAWAPDANQKLNAINLALAHNDALISTAAGVVTFPIGGLLIGSGTYAYIQKNYNREGMPGLALGQSLHALPSGDPVPMLHFRKDASHRLFTRRHPVLDFIEQSIGYQLTEDQKFGFLAHYFQDSFSHTDVGKHGDGDSPDEKSFPGGFGRGHIAYWTSPDTVNLHPKLFKVMAEQFYRHIAAYAKKYGCTPRLSLDEFMRATNYVRYIDREDEGEEDAAVEDYIIGLLKDNKAGYRTDKWLPEDSELENMNDMMMYYRKVIAR